MEAGAAEIRTRNQGVGLGAQATNPFESTFSRFSILVWPSDRDSPASHSALKWFWHGWWSDEWQVVLTKHHGFFPRFNDVTTRQRQSPSFQHSLLSPLPHFCLPRPATSIHSPSANHLSSSSVSSVSSIATTESSSCRDSLMPTLLGLQLEHISVFP